VRRNSQTHRQALPSCPWQINLKTATTCSEVGTSKAAKVEINGGTAKAKVAAKVRARGRSQESFRFSRGGICFEELSSSFMEDWPCGALVEK